MPRIVITHAVQLGYGSGLSSLIPNQWAGGQADANLNGESGRPIPPY
jgi:hypothetical protein